MDKVLVSVIVPVYNVQDYVQKCLASLSRQSYDNIEIVIVDDGSTDKSGEICDAFAKNEARAKIYHKKNGGLSDARNYGISKSRGEYVAFVDSDDYVRRDFIEKMVKEVEKGAQIVVCGYNEFVPKDEIISGEEATIRLLTKQENLDIIACNKIYEKKLFNGISYPKGDCYEDNLTTYKLLSLADKVSYVSESLYKYNARDDSITKTDDKETRLIARERAANEAIEYFKERTKLKEAAEISLLTAKFAFIDNALNKYVEKNYYNQGRKWIIKNKKKLFKNSFLTKKLKIYIIAVTQCGGLFYRLFRLVCHE